MRRWQAVDLSTRDALRNLLWSMAGLFLVVLVLPATQSFFGLDPPDDLVSLAALGIAAIVWSFARLFVPGDRLIGARARDNESRLG